MPIYEYICKQCEITFEFFHIRKDEKAQCPKCETENEADLEKQVSAPDHVVNGASAKNNYGLKRY